MPQFPPESLISRHVEKLLARGEQERVGQLLRQCGLERSGNQILSTNSAITDETCYRYKQLVKQLYGEAAYSFAKVNFVLGGCKCKDCVGS